ncbi:MAG: isoprenylcysteine carboxylmethyltransferase family protein [Pirellulales bacterium]
MALSEEIQSQGQWLFRWRSYLPLILAPLMVVAIVQANGTFETESHEVSEYLGFAISWMGLLIRAITVGHTPENTSGRNSKRQIADRLNSTGMYSIVRHPLYLGNYFIGLGVSTVLLVWWLPVIYSLLFWIYYERIMFAEEAYLRQKFGADYLSWAAETPAFVPRFSKWRKPNLPFSWLNVLRREYNGLTVVVLGHCGLECTELLVQEHRIVWEAFWAIVLFGGLAAYFALRHLKRNTTLLEVPGR